jgi:hypothetical protein
MQAVKEDTSKVSMSEKLVFEISNTLKKLPSRSVKLRNFNISQALANRSNIHYRW